MTNVQWAARKMSASKSAWWLSAGKAGAEAVMGPLSQQLLLTAAPSLLTACSSVHSDLPNLFAEQSWEHSAPSFNLSFPPKALPVLGTKAGRGPVNTPAVFTAFQALGTYTKKPCYRRKLQFRNCKILRLSELGGTAPGWGSMSHTQFLIRSDA